MINGFVLVYHVIIMKAEICRLEELMKKKWMVLTGMIAALGIVSVVFAAKIKIEKNPDGTSVSIIGGADGPTSIFLAGKLTGGESEVEEYTSITMEEAKKVFAEKGDYLILDVRRADEFAEGHIPGAINVPNEEILTEEPEELPDKDQVIYVYCRSGRRSKEASEKLAAMGYTNIIECGGILEWTGETEKE